MELISLVFSLQLLPKEITKIVLSLVEENPVYEIYLDLETKGFGTLAVENSTERKTWHLWAAKHGIHHFGFVDKSRESERTHVYKCPDCEKWRHKAGMRVVVCCSDEDGNPICSDSRYACNECDNILIDSTGDAEDDVQERSWARNNKILFMKNMDYTVAKRMGLTKKAIRKVVRRRFLFNNQVS